MALDFLTAEVYKFAASQLKGDLEAILRTPDYDCEDAMFKRVVALEVRYLLTGSDDAHAKRLQDSLEVLGVGVQSHLFKNPKFQEREKMKNRIKILGAYLNSGIPFIMRAVDYYAGIRLNRFMDERIRDGSANDDWYVFCEALHDRIKPSLLIFTADYDIAQPKLEGLRSRAIATGESMMVSQSVGVIALYDVFQRELADYYKKFRDLIKGFEETLPKFKQYVAHHP